VPDDPDEPSDFVGTFWVEAAQWRPSIREAIDAAMDEETREAKP
jgi:hypothetical protein